jgi:hypothetical protein
MKEQVIRADWFNVCSLVIFSIMAKLLLIYCFWIGYDAPDPYQVFGADEGFWHGLSINVKDHLQDKGFVSCVLNLEKVTGTIAYGYPFFIGLVLSVFGDSVFFVLCAKQIVYAFGCLCFYGFCLHFFRSKKVAAIGLVFCLIYPPIVLNGVSLFRIEIMFTFVSLTCYAGIKSATAKRFLPQAIYLLIALSSLLFLLTFRLNAAAALLLFLGLLFLRERKTGFLLLFIAIPFAELLLAPILGITGFVHYALGFIDRAFDSSMPLYEMVFGLTKFFFAPLPWKIGADIHHLYNAWWYSLSLGCLLLLPFYFHYFARSCFQAWSIVLFILAYLSSYLLVAAVMGSVQLAIGPRTFALIGPFAFVAFYSHLIRSCSLVTKHPSRVS